MLSRLLHAGFLCDFGRGNMNRLKQWVTIAVQVPLYLISLPFLLVILIFVRTLDLIYRYLLPHGRAAFFPLEMFPWATNLEKNWFKIRKELDALLINIDEVPNYQDLSPSLLTDDDKWKAIVLSVAGHTIEENAAACPETTKLLTGVPGLQYAMFSVLRPNKHLKPHRSLYSGVLNCHLALRIPKDRESCALRVSGETAHYDEGRMLVFNDLNEHEAWNRSNELRVVLLMYIVRPLPFPLSVLNRFVIYFSKYLRAASVSQIRKVASEAGRKLRAEPKPVES
jgi:beta-hydroxylase